MRSRYLYGTFIAIVAWFALALQLYILINNVPGNGLTYFEAIGRFLLFFTVLTNLLAAICITSITWSSASKIASYFSKPSVQTAIAVYIFVVGLIYNVILRWQWKPHGRAMIADELLHVAIPLLYIIYWFLNTKKGTLTWKSPLPWLLYPAVYLAYALIRGNIEGFYPYPFIDLAKEGAVKVAMNSTGILIVFLAISYLFVAIDKLSSTDNRQ